MPPQSPYIQKGASARPFSPINSHKKLPEPYRQTVAAVSFLTLSSSFASKSTHIRKHFLATAYVQIPTAYFLFSAPSSLAFSTSFPVEIYQPWNSTTAPAQNIRSWRRGSLLFFAFGLSSLVVSKNLLLLSKCNTSPETYKSSAYSVPHEFMCSILGSFNAKALSHPLSLALPLSHSCCVMLKKGFFSTSSLESPLTADHMDQVRNTYQL